MRQVTGLVKWFDPVKGFGFVVAETGGPDILLHVNVLRNFGQSSVADAAKIVISVQDTNRGVQAVEVLSIEPPVGNEDMPLSDFVDLDLEAVRRLPLVAARVKWFDK
ncbi:MAG: cold shock domain-containing protein, partial [Paracoccaceae bacterium]